MFKRIGSFFQSREREKGQTLILFAIFLPLLILPIAAYAIDFGMTYHTRRHSDNTTDVACMDAATAINTGYYWRDVATYRLNEAGYDSQYYEPQEGTGPTLGKGLELSSEVVQGIPVPVIRVAVWGPTTSWFHSFIGRPDGLTIGARAKCTAGLGGVLPILIKEYENDPPDWEWGDTVVMFGDGWDANTGTSNDPRGVGNPDIYCLDGGPSGDCSDRLYRDPPAPDGAQVNTLKNVVLEYMKNGYDGPIVPVGTFIPRQSGISNNQTVRAFLETHNIGDYVAVMIINDGDVYDGERGFDNVEVIGYAIFQVDDHDANTVWGHPVTEILTHEEIFSHFPVESTLLAWE